MLLIIHSTNGSWFVACEGVLTDIHAKSCGFGQQSQPGSHCVLLSGSSGRVRRIPGSRTHQLRHWKCHDCGDSGECHTANFFPCLWFLTWQPENWVLVVILPAKLQRLVDCTFWRPDSVWGIWPKCPRKMDCVCFCFLKLVQNDLDEVRRDWNTHRIRPSVMMHTAPPVCQMSCFACHHHLLNTGAARNGQGGHLLPPGNVQMGICNPSPEFLTVFVAGLSRISGVVLVTCRFSCTVVFHRQLRRRSCLVVWGVG